MFSLQTTLFGKKFFDRRIYLFIGAIIALFAFDAVAIYNSWYFYYAWVDIPVHITGGLILSVLFYYIAFTNRYTGLMFGVIRNRQTVFSVMIFWVLVTAIGWEIAEFLYGRTIISPKFIPDTFLDIIATVGGALLGYIGVKLVKKL